MTAFIKLDTLEYPLYAGDIRARFPQTSFPSEFVPPDGFAPVQETSRPAFDPATQRVEQTTPTLLNGVWSQAWQVRAATVEEVAAWQASEDAQTERASLNGMKTEVKADATAQYLRTHTPAEIEAYVTSNVTDLASARNVIKKLAVVVGYLIRDRLKQST